MPVNATAGIVGVTGSNTYELTGLQKNILYTITVSAATSAGSGPSEAVNATTLEAVPTGAVTFTQSSTVAQAPGSSAVFLEWTPPAAGQQNGALTNYSLTYFYNDSRLSPAQGPNTTVTVAAGPSVTGAVNTTVGAMTAAWESLIS